MLCRTITKENCQQLVTADLQMGALKPEQTKWRREIVENIMTNMTKGLISQGPSG